MKKKGNLLLVAILGIFLSLPCNVFAELQDFRLTAYSDYQTEYVSGRILPVLGWNEALEALHPDGENKFRTAKIYIEENLIYSTKDGKELRCLHPGVIMGWGDESDDGEIIAAWEWVLPQDPNLTNACISLTAWPREDMTSISFSLKDVNGKMKGWRWPVGGPTGLPTDAGTTIIICASGGAGQAGATGFWDGGADLTQIVSFEFDESGVAIPGGITLPNNIGGFVGQWNFWHDIIVFPCNCDENLEKIEAKLDALEIKLDRLPYGFALLKNSLNTINNSISALETKMDALETKADNATNERSALEQKLDSITPQ